MKTEIEGIESIKTEESLISKTHTTRQWNVYKLLEYQYYQNPKKSITLREIYNRMRIEYPLNDDNYGTLNAKSTWNNQPARRQLTRDLKALKLSGITHHLVITNGEGVKIASEEDISKLKRERASHWESIKTINFQIKKAELNGQYKMPFNNEKEIIEVFRKESVSTDYWD